MLGQSLGALYLSSISLIHVFSFFWYLLPYVVYCIPIVALFHWCCCFFYLNALYCFSYLIDMFSSPSYSPFRRYLDLLHLSRGSFWNTSLPRRGRVKVLRTLYPPPDFTCGITPGILLYSSLYTNSSLLCMPALALYFCFFILRPHVDICKSFFPINK